MIEIGRAIRINGNQWAEENWNAKKSALVSELHQAFAVSDKPDTLDAIKNWPPEGMAFMMSEKRPVRTKKRAA